jgi:hypothetical protein
MNTTTQIVDEFYSCGSLDEPEGLTFHQRKYKVAYDEQGNEVARTHHSGSPNAGYKEQVMSFSEIQALQKEYGQMGAYGLVNKKGKAEHENKVQERRDLKIKKSVEANRINFKLTQRDADAIGEDHEAVFASKHPQVSEDVKALLFAKVRAAQAKVAKKGK